MTEPAPSPAAAPLPKEDPESLVLRGRPRPAVRFRRGLIAGLAGTVALALITVSWLALDPPSFHQATVPLDSEDPGRTRGDALSGLPKSYGDVPRLGPPLPGDLGRPILEHERSLGAGTGSPEPDPALSLAEQQRAAAEAERQRMAAARAAARSSPLAVVVGSAPPAPPPGEAAPARAVVEETVGTGPVAAGQPRKNQFAGDSRASINPHALAPAPSPWTMSAGTVISASLLTGLNSDLPGTVIAQVTEHVRDSATGRTILIPQGARLIGAYDSAIAYGQRRAQLVWRRIIFPDGASLELDKLPAADASGFTGLADRVNGHGWQLLKGVALSTLLGVGTQLGLGGSESGLVRAIRESLQQNAANAGGQITARNLDIQPTITVRPGWPVRVIVNQDLVLQPWRE